MACVDKTCPMSQSWRRRKKRCGAPPSALAGAEGLPEGFLHLEMYGDYLEDDRSDKTRISGGVSRSPEEVASQNVPPQPQRHALEGTTDMKMEEIKKEIKEEVDMQPRHLIDDMPSPSASPPPPTASPVLAAESPGGSPEDQNAPVMLTTMQPVPLNVMDLPKEYLPNSYDDRPQEFIYQVDGKSVEIVRQDDLPPGTVSVVVQQPGGLLPAYQTPGTTVLVLSELVEDVGNVRKHGKEGTRGLLLRCSPVGVGQGRMSEALPGGGGGEHYYYEHPLTAATTAMLNISSSANDEPNGTMGYVYEYYKLPPMPQDKDKLAEIWPATSSASGIASQTKATNGLAGGELAPPIGDLQGLFLHGQQLKREPEDLSHHRKSPSDLDGGIIKGGRQKVLLVTPGGEDLVVDVVNNNSIKDGLSSPQHGGRSVNGTPTSTGSVLVEQPVELIATADGLKPTMSYSTQIFSPMANATHSAHSGTPSPNPYNDHGGQYTTSSQGGISAGYITTSAGAIRGSASSAFPASDPYYREYFSGDQTYVRQQVPVYADSPEGAGGTIASGTSAFVDRYVRGQNTAYHSKGVIAAAGLTVDLPSPDSGIGADTVTPRDQTQIQQSFDYTDLCQAGILSDQRIAGGPQQSPGQGQGRSRPWHDFGRQNDADKIQIPKIYSNYGFKYHLETPISTSQRREDDRITYINKGQFYGITLDYIPDPDKPLKSQTVKSIVMLMFREEKSPEDEIKAWQFWHGRQHSVKQRILDADTKNSVGLVGCIEEVSHNAIAVYWNPLESSAKINVAVQCLSTDFSSQKGVKGLPLHLQIDTYEDPREGPVYHRGYCQIKVFCDKGAERKTRDEERRAAKRKMTATGRKKIDELYHPACERSEFYSMSDLSKPPVLFSPAEDSIDKFQSQMDLQNFYGHDPENGTLANGESNTLGKQSPYLMHSKPATTPTLKFHNHFPPEPLDKKDGILDGGLTTDGTVFSPPLKRPKIMSAPPHNERVMLYVRQEGDEVYTPLHVVPPTTQGLLNAIENKYKISASNISNLYRKNRKGITVKIDDDMLKYYCNEDLFLMDIRQDRDECDMIEITLIELIDR